MVGYLMLLVPVVVLLGVIWYREGIFPVIVLIGIAVFIEAYAQIAEKFIK